MKKNIIKKLAAIAVLSCLLAITALAATDNTSVGELGSAYLNCYSTSAYADTTANSSGTESSDYVRVSITATEYGGASYSDTKTNTGPNYTSAYVSTSGYNLKTASGSHAIKRGLTTRTASTYVSF